MISLAQVALDSAPRETTEEQAAQLWVDILARQGLAGGPALASAVDIAERTLGLHAARLPSPYATLLSRIADPVDADVVFDSTTRPRPLTTVRCMRKTLHTLPPTLAAVAHTATRRYRERDALRAALNAGLSAHSVAAMAKRVVHLLTAGGVMGARAIETELTAAGHTKVAVRVAVKAAWEQGRIVYVNEAQHWNRERRAFGATTHLAPQITAGGDAASAVRDLMIAYFDRYGPASIRDAMWWSGLSRTQVVNALNTSGRPVLAFITPWAASPIYMFGDTPLVAAVGEPDTHIDFLAHEDVALKAYFETRRRYLGELAQRATFNQIGEVWPTIVRGGQVAGLWSWDRVDNHVAWTTFIRCGRRETARLNEKADRLTFTLRARYDDAGRPTRPAMPTPASR